MVAWRWLSRATKEILVGAYLLLPPRFVGQRRHMIGKDLGDPRGTAHRRNNRPKRVVARSVEADGFNHVRKLSRFGAKIKRQKSPVEQKKAVQPGDWPHRQEVVTSTWT